jgi:hypothetical protein
MTRATSSCDATRAHKQGGPSLGAALCSICFTLALCGSAACSDGPPASTGTAGATSVAGAGLGGTPTAGAGTTGGSSQAGSEVGAMATGGGGNAPGSGGFSGSNSVACHEEGTAGPLTTRLPCLLSETGLYAADMVTLAADVHPFSPSFQLWTDGAKKQRFIALPAGAKIDTSDMDYWSFPIGTKLWKEFVRDGVRVETRLLEKQPSGSWYAVAYQWRADQSEADAVPNGVMNASGTQHDVPNNDQCFTCHSQTPDKALGFSALQLSHDALDAADPLEWTLGTLIAHDLLTAPPTAPFSIPGSDLERRFFGYLHANCSHCHNPKGTANDQTGLDMFLKIADLSGAVADFSVYRDLRDVDIVWLDGQHPEAPKRVASDSLAESAVYQRFITKGEPWSMPPLGTELVDANGKQLIEDFIGSLK